MKKTTKKPAKKVTVKKAPAKKPAQKTTKKISVTKKVAVAMPAPNSSHRKQRGRTAPNRALSVTKKTTVAITKSKETAKNKKPSKVKWVKKGPKKLGVVKVVKTIETPAQLLDLSKSIPPVSFPREQINPVDGSPKPWGSIAAPFKPVTCAVPVQQAKAIWVGPDTNASTTAPVPQLHLPTCSVSQEFKSAIQSIDPSANWRPVMPR